MKRKDIREGQQYAARFYRRARQDDLYRLNGRMLDFYEQVVVTEVPATGNIVVKVVDKQQGPEVTLDPASFLCPWADLVERSEHFRQVKSDRLTRTQQAAETIARLVPADQVPWWAEAKVERDGSFSTEGKVSTTDLAKMLEAAYAAGQASVTA